MAKRLANDWWDQPSGGGHDRPGSGDDHEPPRGWLPARLRAWLRALSLVLAVGYLAGLAAAALLLRFVGEAWWPTTILLYLPRIGFALPLPVVALALWLFGPRRLLWSLPLAALLLLFPLMGLRTGLSRLVTASARAGGPPPITLLSYNIATGQRPEEVAAVVRRAAPDILVMQEYKERIEESLADLLRGYHRHSAGQFSIASRYPIADVYLPPRLDVPESEPRSARFVRYRVDSPLGPLHVINVHPVSPRNGLEEARGNGFLHELLRGRIGHSEGLATMTANSRLRHIQAEEIAAEAARSPHPVIIAGDTNMPGLSRTYARTLGRYEDGFEAAGRGFGYTFPAHRPWMRIDRVLTGPGLRVVRFEVIADQASDHLAVRAEIAAK